MDYTDIAILGIEYFNFIIIINYIVKY